MSLISIISAVEEERALNNTLLERLIEQIDSDLARIEAQFAADKAHLLQRKAIGAWPKSRPLRSRGFPKPQPDPDT